MDRTHNKPIQTHPCIHYRHPPEQRSGRYDQIVKETPGIAAAGATVGAHDGGAGDRAGGFKLFESKAFGKADTHVVNLHQLSDLHAIAPALGVVLKRTTTFWLYPPKVEGDRHNAVQSEQLFQ